MKCDKCGKIFVPGNRPDGIPNGVRFVLKDGRKLTMCAECIMKVGAEKERKERRGQDERI